MILKAEDPNLVKVETEDSDIGSSAFLFDLNILKNTLHDLGGMGIAAPQLGIQRRLFLIESKPNERYPLAPVIDLLVIANPKIISQSVEVSKDWEGCLSVSGQRVKVLRPQEVSFTYQDETGAAKQLTLQGFGARIFFHEYDHLEGLTILDRALDPDDIISNEEYFKKIESSI